MRGKKAIINTMMNLVEEIIAVICGFILPRLILQSFGSQYNGLISSITQFLGCAVLLRSGIGGATRAALYRPLATNNSEEINGIVKATNNFMKKIGAVLAISILLFASIYPFLVNNDFDWLFTFSLFIIIGASTFADSFFGITYLIILQADQSLWISSLMKSICTILNTIIASWLIISGLSIHIVKLGSAFVYVLYPIILGIVVRKRYNINTQVEPNNKAIAQRWDAFWHQIAVFVMNNTDVMVLTFFTNMLEVSVYSVYNMVFNGLKRVITSFTNSLEAAFGNMIALHEDSVLKKNVEIIETLLFGIATIVYTSAILLILDFVGIYTRGINDINYLRPSFAAIIILAHFFNSIRLPYQLVVQAAGRYKETKKGAIVEPIINITISIICVIKFGLVGVAIGTLVATVFRTYHFSHYMSRNIVHRSELVTLQRCLVSFAESGLIVFIVSLFKIASPTSYLSWVIKAIIVFSISLLVVISGSLAFYKDDVSQFYRKIRRKNVINLR